jgi:hypothetical protein
MKKFLIAAVLIAGSLTAVNAQNQHSDFASKLKPEYKLNLNNQSKEQTAVNIKKTAAELDNELKYFNIQQKNVEQEIARMDADGISKEDNMYVKMQLSLKYIKGQIAGREKYLQRYQSK